MITPEQLINDLQKENQKLKEELEQAQKDIKYFEILAIEWKKGFGELNKKHKEELTNANQTIDELKFEIQELKEKEEARDYRE